MIVPFWIQGLALGLYYVPNDDDKDDFDVEVHTIQLALGFFGISFMWWGN